MAKAPLPLPRKYLMGKSLDSARASGPPSPSDTPGPGVGEGKMHGPDRPGVAHKKWPVRHYSQPEVGNAAGNEGGVADRIKQFEAEKYQNKQVMGSPLPKATFVFDGDDPSTPLSQDVFFQQDINLDADCLIEWWEKVQDESWEQLVNDPEHTKKGEAEQFTVKAQRVLNAVQLFNLLLNTHGENLKSHIYELNGIADNLDKFSKGTKIAGITGGATGAVGGAAAVAGVLFAPVTFGASLALTVLGVGVAAAGGVTGASAAIANKVSSTNDRKKIELVLQDFQAKMDDIEACLTFMNVGMEQLRKHDLSTLKVVNTATYRVAKAAEVTGVGSTSAIKASSKVSGNLQGFALGMDMYFSKSKNAKGEPKLKSKLASEFGRKIREMAQQLDEGLNELFKVKDGLVENNLIL
ncbi:uncharacterized protein LOC109616078 isoform X1 [Esox lucius]|uniref:uncharacterized protein LOC109616078 isoform X1 n=2 Tax=Esox lucius TaxID=8010 RepID=UPI00147749AA|nr:uncharacterized protein LOC109616078 isoform X1 [Esox lucius]